MRNFKIKQRTKPIFISKATFINITLLTGVLVFVALAALTGKVVSDNIIGDRNDHNDSTVVVSDGDKTVSGETEPGTSENQDISGVTISVDGKEYYLVQFGMFANESNAKVCANSIAAMGGAGYIKNIDGKNYVFAMCYGNMNDAKTVVTQLKEQGYSTIIKSFSHNGLTMKLKGNEIGISTIESSMIGMNDTLSALETIIYKFDKKEIERTTAKTQLQKLMENLDTYRDVFNRYATQLNQDKIEQFERAGKFCDEFYNDISSIMKSETDTELSSGMKHVYINNVFNLIECIDN